MTTLLSWSLLAVSFATSGLSTPLSTSSNYASSRRPSFQPAPLHAFEHPHGSVNNSYIVVLRDDVPEQLVQNHMNFLQLAHESNSFLGNSNAGGIKHVYDGLLKGYAGEFADGVIDQVRMMPEVDYIELDQLVHTMDIDTQKMAPWGLARISHRPRLGFSTFTRYEYDNDGGEGVEVYVIDTGINVEHVEFEGRASWGKTIPTNDVDEDGNGHGSHCAGTIASARYGVAKKANVTAVKVLGSNGSGSMSDVLSGVQWAAIDAQQKKAQADAELAATGRTRRKGSVANMSLGGGKSPSLDTAVDRAVQSGLHFAVAAGNDNKDACNYSPAASKEAVTVGASTLGDERAYFSNWGKCVDVFAPGLNILSTYTGGPTKTATLSGTSMASPHVAGLLAYLLSIYPSETFSPEIKKLVPDAMDFERSYTSFYSLAHVALPGWMTQYLPSPQFLEAVAPIPAPAITPAQLKEALIELSSRGLLTDLPSDTVNLLVFNNATST
ncbi:hypothetical protein CONPUDRAFT_82713 [Coniophora puteana RWD-64-598 SS2]|uniref:Serine-type endopeptidase n=1 Tax=Coniophora puteana (strain RWD-64-598) TaxID=741705 RepID=A0A5M3MN20_CONPW|nr:uncharacterized protein CONPUDRAFT_82713 [Coniophora puteana RWD-64-598 SS2]EIW80493.1 hypothetical protein CONPUDRAFT_82713 [Coniophora puteana RWD-64-598 SS2]